MADWGTLAGVCMEEMEDKLLFSTQKIKEETNLNYFLKIYFSNLFFTFSHSEGRARCNEITICPAFKYLQVYFYT